MMYNGTTLEANKSEAVTLQAPNLIRTEIPHLVLYLSYQVNGTKVLPVLDIEHTLNLESEGRGIFHQESQGNKGHFKLEIEGLRDQGSLNGWKYNIQQIFLW